TLHDALLIYKDVEFGLAANGISGIETALGVVLAMVDAGLVTLQRAIGALSARKSTCPTRRSSDLQGRRVRARGERDQRHRDRPRRGACDGRCGPRDAPAGDRGTVSSEEHLPYTTLF